MLRPFLLIGIGGSGGKTLRVIRQDLELRLRTNGWGADEAFPDAWQFLHIDVASHPDGDDPDLPPQLPIEDFLGLVSPGLAYRTLDSALTQDRTTAELLDALGGWRPDAHKVTVTVDKGAGQFRAIGRVVTLTCLPAIKTRLENAVNRLTDAGVKQQLQRINALLGQGGDRTVAGDPVVIVVSSIAGGSGAGAVLDVCDALRSFGKTWLDESIGILYAPDVFDAIPPANRKGVRPNALATLTELMAGYWTRGYGGMTSDSALLFNARGLSSGSIDQVGPRYPNLVGARNADVFYGTQNEVYRGMGKGIAAWMTSEQLQSQMDTSFIGNHLAASQMTDRLGLKMSGMDIPFTAMGFARLSLGRESFAEYAAQRLARESVERLLRQHLTQRSPHEDVTDAALIASIADRVWLNFLAGTRLDERGPDRNDVLDALRSDAAVKAQVQAWAATQTGRVTAGVPAEGLPVGAWTSRVEGALKEQGSALTAAIAEQRSSTAQRWVAKIQQHLAEYALRTLATHGVPVTLALLHKLVAETSAAVREMPEEKTRMQDYAARSRESIRAELTTTGADNVTARSEQVSPAVKEAARALYYQGEADLRALTEELLRDLVTSVLQPMARAVEAGAQQLAQDEAQTGATPSEVQHWPIGADVPPPLRPAKNEFLLDDVERFPAVLAEQLLPSTGETTPRGATAAAVVAVVTDADHLDPAGQRRQTPAGRPAVTPPLEQLQAWVPDVAEPHDGLAAPTRAAYQLHVRAEDLLRRSRAWVTNPDRPLGRHVKMSLRDHLEDAGATPDQRTERLRRFAGQLQGAVARAKPLVDVKPAVLMAVHGKPVPPIALIMGKIPLPAMSEAGRRAREVLIASGVFGPGNDADLFGESIGSSVEMFSVLAEPYEPVVFASLMQPIAEEWAAARSDPNTRQSFWRWRRSRTLPESIPVAPPVRRAMVRGWFAGLALGQVRVGDPGAGVSVWLPSDTGQGGRWASMPFPLLRPVTSDADAMAAVLESLPLALLDVYTACSVDPMAPYQRLTALGTSGSDAGVEAYEELNGSLAQWLRDGAMPARGPQPDSRVGDRQSTPEMRRDATARRFMELRENYQQRFDQITKRGDLPSVPRDYELKEDILGALDDLVSRLQDMIQTSGTTGGFG